MEDSGFWPAPDCRNQSLYKKERKKWHSRSERFYKSWAGLGAGQGHLQEVPLIPPLYRNSRKENPLHQSRKTKEKVQIITFFFRPTGIRLCWSLPDHGAELGSAYTQIFWKRWPVKTSCWSPNRFSHTFGGFPLSLLLSHTSERWSQSPFSQILRHLVFLIQ